MSTHTLYVSSKDREYGDSHDFIVAPFGQHGTHHAFDLSLVSAVIPNTVATVRSGVNDRWYCTVNGVDKSSFSIPAGWYTGTTYAAALKTYIDSIASTAANDSTVTYSALTGKITITFPSDVPGTGIAFSTLGRYSTANRRKSSTERALELGGLNFVYLTNTSGTILTMLDRTVTSSQVYIGANVVKLNGTNYVDIMTNMPMKSYSTGQGGNNLIRRIHMSTGTAANIQTWEAPYEIEVAHVLGADFRPRFYLVDEWGDSFLVSRNHEVSLVFNMNTHQ